MTTVIGIICISVSITFFAHSYILNLINSYGEIFVCVLLILLIGIIYDQAQRSVLRPKIKKEKSGALKKDLNIIREEMERSKRYDYDMSIILVQTEDLNELKDKYESPVETIMAGLIGYLSNLTRHSDIIMRFDLNQILIILPNTDNPGSKLVSQKLANLINNNDINGFNITVTVGYAQYFNKGTADELIEEAKLHLKGEISE